MASEVRARVPDETHAYLQRQAVDLKIHQAEVVRRILNEAAESDETGPEGALRTAHRLEGPAPFFSVPMRCAQPDGSMDELITLTADGESRRVELYSAPYPISVFLLLGLIYECTVAGAVPFIDDLRSHGCGTVLPHDGKFDLELWSGLRMDPTFDNDFGKPVLRYFPVVKSPNAVTASVGCRSGAVKDKTQHSVSFRLYLNVTLLQFAHLYAWNDSPHLRASPGAYGR